MIQGNELIDALDIPGDDTWSDVAVLAAPRAETATMLKQTKNAMFKGRGVIAVTYNGAALGFRAAIGRKSTGVRTVDMPVEHVAGSPDGRAYEVDVDSFIALFSLARSPTVELHVGHPAATPEQRAFRMVEEFEVDGHPCRVTRSCTSTPSATA